MKKRMSFRQRFLKKQTASDALQNENRYYENISAHLGILQVILYCALLAFVVLSFLRNTNLITYQNFYYFFKDLNASAETVDVLSTDSVSYPTNTTQSFTLYRKGLAVAGNTSVTIFTATGRQTVSELINYQNPVAVGSGKYLLVYEMGGTRYSLYNSYTQIHKGESDHSLLGATVSDNGMYALITSAEEYSSVVLLYNSHFSLINRYNKIGFVMDVSIDANGKNVAILTSDTESGLFTTKLEIFTPGTPQAKVTTPLGNTLALKCSFTSSDRLAVLCTDRVLSVDRSGKIGTAFSFDGKMIVDAEVNEDGIAVCLSSNDVSEKKQLIVFDKNGKLLYNKDADMTVNAIARCRDIVYLLGNGELGRLDVERDRLTKLSANTEKRCLLAVSQTDALLCSPQKAEYIRFGS